MQWSDFVKVWKLFVNGLHKQYIMMVLSNFAQTLHRIIKSDAGSLPGQAKNLSILHVTVPNMIMSNLDIVTIVCFIEPDTDLLASHLRIEEYYSSLFGALVDAPDTHMGLLPITISHMKIIYLDRNSLRIDNNKQSVRVHIQWKL